MFWKKKHTSTDEKKADKAQWIEHDSSSRRETFRYAPTDGSPLSEMTFLKKKVQVMDISAGGLSFRNIDFSENDTDRFTLDVKGLYYRSGDSRDKITLKIVHIDSSNICHAIFQDISTAQADILHQFILEKQKQDIRRAKRGR